MNDLGFDPTWHLSLIDCVGNKCNMVYLSYVTSNRPGILVYNPSYVEQHGTGMGKETAIFSLARSTDRWQ